MTSDFIDIFYENDRFMKYKFYYFFIYIYIKKDIKILKTLE